MEDIISRLDFALDKINAPRPNKGRHQYLATIFETTDRTIRRWYAIRKIPDSKLEKLADVLDVSLSWLSSGEGNYRRRPSEILLQKNEAVIPILPWGNISDWLSNNYEIQFKEGKYKKILLNEMNENSFVLIIELDDLMPYIPKYSLVFIDPTEKPKNKDFVLIKKYDGVKPIIRRYIEENGTILLESPAPNVPSTILTKLDEVIGVVKQHITSYI